MKKVLVTLLGLVVAFTLLVSPASAAAQRSKLIVLDTPPTAYQGEIFEVSFKVTSTGKPEEWRVEFPKNTISFVSFSEKRGLSLTEDAEKYTLYFNLKQLKNKTVSVQLTIAASALEDMSLLTVYDHNNTFVEEKRIVVLVPEIVWSVESPFSYPVSTDFQIFLRAVNNTTLPLAFDVVTVFFHDCTDRSVFPSSYPVLAVNGGGGSSNYWLQYSGVVPAGETYEWVFDMRSTGYACNAPVFELIDNYQGGLSTWKQWIVVLAP